MEFRRSNRVTVEQSEDAIDVLLLLAVSSLSYLRGLFDDRHFKDANFRRIHGTLKEEELEVSTISAKVLMQNVSREADTLISWLRNPVSEAIRRKYLRAISLSVILDKRHPEISFETYIFRISYEKRVSPFLPAPGDDTFSRLGVSEQAVNMLKNFIAETQDLPDLPPKRYLSMRLILSEEAPEDYIPETFEELHDKVDARSKTQKIVNCGSVTTIHHQMLSEIGMCSNVGSGNKLRRADKRNGKDIEGCVSESSQQVPDQEQDILHGRLSTSEVVNPSRDLDSGQIDIPGMIRRSGAPNTGSRVLKSRCFHPAEDSAFGVATDRATQSATSPLNQLLPELGASDVNILGSSSEAAKRIEVNSKISSSLMETVKTPRLEISQTADPGAARPQAAAKHLKVSADLTMPTTSVQSTQDRINMGISCTCGSSLALPFSETLFCNRCSKGFHKVCYSYCEQVDGNFICTDCRGDRTGFKGIRYNFCLQILMNVRKFISLVQHQKGCGFMSATELYCKLGFTPEDHTHIRTMIKALSLLIADAVIVLQKELQPLLTLFVVDLPGIEDYRCGVPIQLGTYFIHYNPRDIISSYLDGKDTDSFIKSYSMLYPL
ncbi:DEKNAAC101989 [Brettanomyces naardenensis]|uniref:DEKNAAC101989 n=1 Tax=Brettanomyces naardenensis TaxID=13370 RepID=A0A448YJJ8_BRENA|nr:DEKNAAC101989 [Brettanomyces naardenensis]